MLTTSRPGQNGCHFADDIFKNMFLYKTSILIQIALKYLSMNPINDKSSSVQIMAWHRIGAKPLSELMMVHFINKHRSYSAAMSALLPGIK